MTAAFVLAFHLLLTWVILSESYYVYKPNDDYHTLVIVDEAPG